MRRKQAGIVDAGKWAKSSNDVAAGGAATVTIAAIADERHVIDAILYSYAAAPTSGSVTVAHGSTTLKLAITDAGWGIIPFPGGYDAPDQNQAVVITLADGTQVKNLIVRYR